MSEETFPRSPLANLSHLVVWTYVPIPYELLPRRMRLPLESGAGMTLAFLKVHGCMGKGGDLNQMKAMLEVRMG